MLQPWTAPVATAPVHATVPVPGSKSITNRALLLAALSGAACQVRGALRSRDTDLMAAALRALAVPVRVDDGVVAVGAHDGFAGGGEVDCGLAGTVMRFVPPLAALADGPVRFDGDPRARERPMSTMLDALRMLGSDVDGNALPFVVHGTGTVGGGEVRIDASGSSQFVSGLLLSAARYQQGVLLHHDGPPVPSLPHVEMTVRMLRRAGVEVDANSPHTWRVAPGPVRPLDWDVEPDLSNATVFLAAAAATAGEVTVPGWPVETTQAGDAIRPILQRMGCSVRRHDGGLTVRGPERLSGVDVDLREAGELTPTVAALAALAATSSRLRGVAHLRGHESDRLAALATGIGELGGEARERPDGLEIRPRPLRAVPDRPWRAHGDHRMATAGAILGLMVPGLTVDDISATTKTLPDFPAMWAATLAGGPMEEPR